MQLVQYGVNVTCHSKCNAVDVERMQLWYVMILLQIYLQNLYDFRTVQMHHVITRSHFMQCPMLCPDFMPCLSSRISSLLKVINKSIV